MALIKPEQLRSGSYSISGSFSGSFFGDVTGSLFGTSSFALTASYSLNAPDIFRISTGSVSASVDVGPNIFLITNNNTPVLTLSQSGVLILATQSAELTSPAPNGGIYFTSSSMFLGLD